MPSEQSMMLEELVIRRAPSYYGKDAGKLMGTITFDNSDAKIAIKLTEDRARKMLAIVSEQVIENAKEVSQLLIGNLMPLLPKAQVVVE